MAAFEIPKEFQGELEVIELDEQRSDNDILASLRTHVPVTSEKNIWAYWDKGIDHLPSWCRRNVINWVRICGPGWTVRVLDNVPGSPNHVLEFIPRDMFPACFLEGTMNGKHVGQHSADMMKGPVLVLYGGVSMDVGCMLFRDLERGLWSELEDPASPYEVAAPIQVQQIMANHFLAARKGNPLVERWHRLFIHLWADRTNAEELDKEPLMTFLTANMSLSKLKASGFHWDFKAPFGEVLSYAIQNACWARVCMLGGTEDDLFSGAEYWVAHGMAIDTLHEHWAGKTLMGGGQDFGERLTAALSVRLDGDAGSESYREAHQLVWSLLARACMQKTSRGSGLVNATQPGTIWDERPGVECKPGTFGELLQYGAVHFRQKRENFLTLEVKEPLVVLKKGLLEV